MSKFCSQCGAPIDEGAQFCGNCGSPVDRHATDAPRNNGETIHDKKGGNVAIRPNETVTEPEYEAKTVGKIIRKFRTAGEAYTFAEQFVLQWKLYFNELADRKEFKAFCATLDEEFKIPDGSKDAYYVIDILGAVGFTENAEKNIKWLAKVHISNPQARERSLADSPKKVISDEVKRKLKAFKERFTFKGMSRKLIWSAGLMLLTWTTSTFFPGLMGGRGSFVKKFIDFVTFAQGGVSNNIFFQIGGFFGKTLVMVTLFAVLLGGIKMVIKGFCIGRDITLQSFKSNDRMLRAMFLFGAGAAMNLYNFFTGDAARFTLSMAGIAGVLSMFWALGGGVHFIRRMVVSLTADKDKESKLRFVNSERTRQVLSGMAVGFALSVLLTLTGIRHMPYSIGLILIILGYVIYRKTATPKLATVLSIVAMLSLPVIGTLDLGAQSQSKSIGEQVEDMRKAESLEYYDAKTMSAAEQKAFLKKIGAPLTKRDGRNDEVQYGGTQIWYFNGKDGNVYNIDYGPDGSFNWAQLVQYGNDGLGAAENGADNASDAAKGAAEALAILSILIALLENNGGNGEIIGGPAPGWPESYPPFGTLGGDKWIMKDPEGVITKRNPVTGEESWWVPNDDGTYTRYGSDEKKSFDDLREDSDYADRNRELFEEIYRKEQEWADENRRKIQEKLEEKNRYWIEEHARREARERELQKQREYIRRKADEHGTFEESLYDYNKRSAEWNEKRAETYKFWGDVWAAGENGAKYAKTGADYSIDFLAAIEPTGTGKAIATSYHVLSEVGGSTAEAFSQEQSLSSVGKGFAVGIVKGGITYVQDKVGAGDDEFLKYVTNGIGEAVKGGVGAYADDKSAKEIKEEFFKGAKNGLVSSGIDHLTGKVGNKVGEWGEYDDSKVEAVGGLVSNIIKTATGDDD